MLILLALLAILALTIPKYSYLVKAIRLAIRHRRLHPTPDEREAFPHSTIQPGNPDPLPKSRLQQQAALLPEHRIFLDDLETLAFLVSHRGELVYEEYADPYGPEYPLGSFSIAKSIVGTLAGIAIDEGYLAMDTPLDEFLPEIKTRGLEDVTVYHTLAMATGLEWSESAFNPFSDNARAYYGTNLLTSARHMKPRQSPGIDFNYTSGNTLLLSMALANATGKGLSAYAEEVLWGKIGSVGPAYWLKDADKGREKAFCCFYACPRDLLRIGLLYINSGSSGSQQVLSQGFIQQAVSPTPFYDRMLRQQNRRYGLHWWLFDWKGHPCFYARGIYGQYLICIPHLDAVIVRFGMKRKRVDATGHPPDLFTYPTIAASIIDRL